MSIFSFVLVAATQGITHMIHTLGKAMWLPVWTRAFWVCVSESAEGLLSHHIWHMEKKEQVCLFTLLWIKRSCIQAYTAKFQAWSFLRFFNTKHVRIFCVMLNSFFCVLCSRLVLHFFALLSFLQFAGQFIRFRSNFYSLFYVFQALRSLALLCWCLTSTSLTSTTHLTQWSSPARSRRRALTPPNVVTLLNTTTMLHSWMALILMLRK